MPIDFTAARTIPKAAQAAIRLCTTDMVAAGLSDVSAAQLKTAAFEGQVGEVHAWPEGNRVAALVGVGSAADVSLDDIRAAGAAVGRGFGRHGRIGVTLAEGFEVDGAAARQALVEGIVLATYVFAVYKSSVQPTGLKRVDVAGGAGAENQAGLDRGAVLAAGQVLARDFVNEPGGTLTPTVFARRTEAMAKKVGLDCKVWDKAAIKKGKLGGLLGVNRGSKQPPRFVELTYTPRDEPTGTLALVGKGVTFDSGGLSLKTSLAMMTMKCDMGGAAAVIGAMSVLAALGVTSRVRAFIPMTDNMTGGDATRPGDVFTIRNGKTIEVLNTDAEGRLILADGLSVASESKPDAIVDLATLTGACMVALGPKIAGVMGNHDGLLEQIEAASVTTGERVWRLPLPADYAKQFESSVADMKNIGTAHGGALTAGLILQEFVGEGIPWAHIDIAGPAFTDAAVAETTKGGTGFGVRLIAELARSFATPN